MIQQLIEKLDGVYNDMNGQEAIFGFAAWLTTRPNEVKMGSNNECGIVADLCGQWCEKNNLQEPREGIYPDNISHPTKEDEEAWEKKHFGDVKEEGETMMIKPVSRTKTRMAGEKKLKQSA